MWLTEERNFRKSTACTDKSVNTQQIFRNSMCVHAWPLRSGRTARDVRSDMQRRCEHSANTALIVAQHQRRLDDVDKRLHLLVAKHCLEHGKDTLGCSRVRSESKHNLCRFRPSREAFVLPRRRKNSGNLPLPSQQILKK